MQSIKNGTETDMEEITRSVVHHFGPSLSATAYFKIDGTYVVKDNSTSEIIQASNRLDPNWVPDATIINPYTTK